MNPRNKINIGKDDNFFDRFDVSSTDFQEECNCLVNIKTSNGLYFINTGENIIEYSFNGLRLHGDLIPGTNTASLFFPNRAANKIWFRAPNGNSSINVSAFNKNVFLISNNTSSGSSPDITDPLLLSSVINIDGDVLTLTYDESLNTSSIPEVDDFSLTGTLATVTIVNIIGSTVILTLSPVAKTGETIAINYSAGTFPIEDVAGNNADNLINQTVTNNSTIEPWVVPGLGTTLAIDLLADNYEAGETGDALAIRDISGNGRDAQQPITAYQPSPTLDAIDGKLAIVHTGTAQDHMYIPGLDTFLNGNNKPFSLGLYLKPGLLDSNGAVISWGSSSTANHYLMIQAPQSTSAKYQQTRRASGTIDGGTTVADATSADRSLFYTFDGTTGRIWISGTEGTLSDSEHAAGILTNDTCVIGAWFSNNTLTRHWTGAWRRICIWDGVLSDSQIADWNTNVVLN